MTTITTGPLVAPPTAEAARQKEVPPSEMPALPSSSEIPVLSSSSQLFPWQRSKAENDVSHHSSESEDEKTDNERNRSVEGRKGKRKERRVSALIVKQIFEEMTKGLGPDPEKDISGTRSEGERSDSERPRTMDTARMGRYRKRSFTDAFLLAGHATEPRSLIHRRHRRDSLTRAVSSGFPLENKRRRRVARVRANTTDTHLAAPIAQRTREETDHQMVSVSMYPRPASAGLATQHLAASAPLPSSNTLSFPVGPTPPRQQKVSRKHLHHQNSQEERRRHFQELRQQAMMKHQRLLVEQAELHRKRVMEERRKIEEKRKKALEKSEADLAEMQKAEHIYKEDGSRDYMMEIAHFVMGL